MRVEFLLSAEIPDGAQPGVFEFALRRCIKDKLESCAIERKGEKCPVCDALRTVTIKAVPARENPSA